MATHLRIIGIEDEIRELQDLPEQLAGEGREIVWSAGANAKQEISEAYPATVKRELQKGMRVRFGTDALHPNAVVENTSHLANWFEYGTQERHTKLGYKRGRMPPRHVFVPIVMRTRRRMQDLLVELLVRHGFRVSA